MEVANGSLNNAREVKEAERGRCNATAMEILATSPENFQTKQKKKGTMQVNIKIKKGKYI